ncbi:MAG: chitosanase [Solirubrobacteraceae bacterium]
MCSVLAALAASGARNGARRRRSCERSRVSELRARAQPPARDGDEVAHLNASLDRRDVEMRKEAAHRGLSRVETGQRRFIREETSI